MDCTGHGIWDLDFRTDRCQQLEGLSGMSHALRFRTTIYVSHSTPAKAKGRPWHWAKPEPWRSVGSCVRTELATENCTKAPGIGPPITRAGGDGRKNSHKPRSTVTLRRPPAYLRGLEPTEECPIRARDGKAIAIQNLAQNCHLDGTVSRYRRARMLETSLASQ